MPRRARYLVPRGLPRRDEILAVCVVLAVLVHLLFAQLTIILAAVFYLVAKLTRWRLSWLVIPAAAGLAWTATGAGAAVAGYTAGAARIAGYLGDRGHQAGHLLHFTGAYAGIGTWLPRQLPLALVAGAVEAALAGWLSWLHTDEQDLRPVRPGLIVAARRAATIHAIRSGRVVARDGGCRGGADGRRGRAGPCRWLRALPARLAGPGGRADHDHAQLGRPGPSVPAQLRLLSRRRLRAARRGSRRPARSGARRRHPLAQPRGHAGPAGVRARRSPPARCAGRADPGIGQPRQRRAGHHRRAQPSATGTARVAVRPLAAPVARRPGGRHRPRPRGHRPRRGALPARRPGRVRKLGDAYPPGLPGPAGRRIGPERDRRGRQR